MLTTIILSVLLQLGHEERVDPHVIPGQISVTYREGVTSEQRGAFEKSVGLPEPAEIPCVTCTYKVHEGHETFWETVLKDFENVHIVQSVERPRRPPSRAELLAELAKGPHREGRVEWRFRSPFARFSVSSAEMVEAKINQYFRDNYAGTATVNVIKRGDHFIELSIDKMKGRVITEPRFWERLEIYVVFFSTKNEAKLFVDYDGYFATGVGSKSPSDESYSNMSEHYGRELSRYADMTTTALVSYLQEGQ